MPDEICLVHYWGMQAPLRLTLSLGLTLYSFFFSASSPLFYGADPSNSSAPGDPSSGSSRFFSHPSAAVAGARAGAGGGGGGWGGDALKNRLFFTFVFVETFSWFWVWVTLQEERREVLARKARRRSSSGGAYSGLH